MLQLSGNQLTTVPPEIGRAVQVVPMKHMLKAPLSKRLKLSYDEPPVTKLVTPSLISIDNN
jgi:hypothetical protein